MDRHNIGHHISQQFNEELEDIRNKVLAMGGMVEQQLTDALSAVITGDGRLGEVVVTNDNKINALEVAIDEECTLVLARRQPTASDLRLIVAIIKTITDLECLGDETERIGRMAVHLAELERPKNNYAEIAHMGNHVRRMLHNALEIGDGLDDGDDQAEVAGGRLAERQHVGAFFVDSDIERIDLVVIGEHHFAVSAGAADHGAERVIELLFDDAAHRQHFIADVLQLVVELLGDVMTDVDSVHYLTSSLHRLRGCHFWTAPERIGFQP